MTARMQRGQTDGHERGAEANGTRRGREKEMRSEGKGGERENERGDGGRERRGERTVANGIKCSGKRAVKHVGKQFANAAANEKK